MPNYDVSEVRRMWKRDGIRYRRVITTTGRTVIEKGINGRYILDHAAGTTP